MCDNKLSLSACICWLSLHGERYRRCVYGRSGGLSLILPLLLHEQQVFPSVAFYITSSLPLSLSCMVPWASCKYLLLFSLFFCLTLLLLLVFVPRRNFRGGGESQSDRHPIGEVKQDPSSAILLLNPSSFTTHGLSSSHHHLLLLHPSTSFPPLFLVS